MEVPPAASGDGMVGSADQMQVVECPVVMSPILPCVISRRSPPETSAEDRDYLSAALDYFDRCAEDDQVAFVEKLLSMMSHAQHSRVSSTLIPMLQRDFISLLPKKGLDHLAETILSYLDVRSLSNAQCVSREWYRVIAEGMLWKKLIERQVRIDPLWHGLAERRGWIQYLFKPVPGKPHPGHSFYRKLYPSVVADIKAIEDNWKSGRPNLQKINCRSENSKGVYCLQYDDNKIVSGLRDNTLKIWERKSLKCTHVLQGHTGSVLCLQYDDQVIISGSSDSTVKVWDVKTGELVNTLIHHCEAVLHLRFTNGMMVTCSKDRSIAVWDLTSPTDIAIRRVLVGHRAAVNVVDFDERYIVSASGDRTIKVWKTSACEYVRTLNGHRRGIACLQYRDRLVVSGSSDNTIRLWDIEFGTCLRVLEGHEELVRCIRFDSKRIVSGAYDGKIKVWDLNAALDHRAPAAQLCVRTLIEHTGRVFRLQFDEFQIVSSSHDDTILIWDFLNVDQPQPGSPLAQHQQPLPAELQQQQQQQQQPLQPPQLPQQPYVAGPAPAAGEAATAAPPLSKPSAMVNGLAGLAAVGGAAGASASGANCSASNGAGSGGNSANGGGSSDNDSNPDSPRKPPFHFGGPSNGAARD